MSSSAPVVVGVSGASGAAYGLAVLELLHELGVDSHLIVTGPGEEVARHELGAERLEELLGLATTRWDAEDFFAAVSSGSFVTQGMIVAPCSIRTVSAVACSRSSNLLERAADVTLKERRPLVLLVRETPLHAGHLRLMLDAATAGATIMPPVPAFYGKPESLDDVVRHTAARALDQLRISHDLIHRWG